VNRHCGPSEQQAKALLTVNTVNSEFIEGWSNVNSEQQTRENI